MRKNMRIEFYENNERIFVEKGSEKCLKKMIKDLKQKYQPKQKLKHKQVKI